MNKTAKRMLFNIAGAVLFALVILALLAALLGGLMLFRVQVF